MMKLHEHTPLIKSNKLSKICGRDVWLKLDNLQPRHGLHKKIWPFKWAYWIPGIPGIHVPGCPVSARPVLTRVKALKSGSFKIRGLGHLVQEGMKQGKTSAVCSSAGNAGMAASYACNASNLPCTVFAPTNTPSFTVENIKALGAEVELHGDYWDMDWIVDNLKHII